MRNPVGKVNADIQKTFGGCKVDAHFVNISILWTKSRVQDANGFDEGYAEKNDNVTIYKFKSVLKRDMTVVPPPSKIKNNKHSFAP